MTDPLYALTAIFVLLQVKHFLCDYPLQTQYQLLNKGTYLHPGGIIHSGFHALLSTPIFLVVPPGVALGLAMVIGEFLFHYHVDWGKDQLIKRNGWTPLGSPFWWSIGADQMLHHLSYIFMGALLVGAL